MKEKSFIYFAPERHTADELTRHRGCIFGVSFDFLTLSGRLGGLSLYSWSARSNTDPTSGCLAFTSSMSYGNKTAQIQNPNEQFSLYFHSVHEK